MRRFVLAIGLVMLTTLFAFAAENRPGFDLSGELAAASAHEHFWFLLLWWIWRGLLTISVVASVLATVGVNAGWNKTVVSLFAAVPAVVVGVQTQLDLQNIALWHYDKRGEFVRLQREMHCAELEPAEQKLCARINEIETEADQRWSELALRRTPAAPPGTLPVQAATEAPPTPTSPASTPTPVPSRAAS